MLQLKWAKTRAYLQLKNITCKILCVFKSSSQLLCV